MSTPDISLPSLFDSSLVTEVTSPRKGATGLIGSNSARASTGVGPEVLPVSQIRVILVAQ
jgi:hypothetical protein